MSDKKYCSNCGTNFELNEERCLVCANTLDGIDYGAKYCLDSRNINFHICSRICLMNFLGSIKNCKEITFEQLQKKYVKKKRGLVKQNE